MEVRRVAIMLGQKRALIPHSPGILQERSGSEGKFRTARPRQLSALPVLRFLVLAELPTKQAARSTRRHLCDLPHQLSYVSGTSVSADMAAALRGEIPSRFRYRPKERDDTHLRRRGSPRELQRRTCNDVADVDRVWHHVRYVIGDFQDFPSSCAQVTLPASRWRVSVMAATKQSAKHQRTIFSRLDAA